MSLTVSFTPQPGATAATDSHSLSVIKVEMDIANTAAEEDDYVIVNGTQNVTARLVGPAGLTKSVAFYIEPSSRATIAPASANLTVGTDVALTLTGVAESTAANDTKIVAKITNITSGEEDFSVYKINVAILEPNEQPVTDNNFTFNAANFGVCNVQANGTSGIANEDSNLEWMISPIIGSTLTSSPTPSRGSSITFTYTSLPASNNEFGTKTLTLTYPLFPGAQDTQAVQIFFSRDATNHPGAGAGITPNWYYYWSQTGASSGTHIYDPNYPNADGYYECGQNHFHICPSAKDQDYGLVIMGEGIDNFGSTCLHERGHMDYWLDTWGLATNTPLTQDGDQDGLRDIDEPNMTGLNGLPYNPVLKDTNGDGADDFEDYACVKENNWIIGSYNSVDWANPGKQSNQ